MADTLPAPLSIEAPGGQSQVLLQKGAALPARARAVFATQRASERELTLRLYDGEGKGRKLVGTALCELPAGLPPNTWLQVWVQVSADLALGIEVTENLRRLRLEPEIDAAGARSKRFRV